MFGAQHFQDVEFREWADDMSPRLVTLLDVLRFKCGSPIEPSLNAGALGRRLGAGSQSAHNVDVWGQVLAVDFFVSGVFGREQAEEIVNLMRGLGFTGIGVYTDTRNNRGVEQVMFHGDVRPTAAMGNPATWGRVNGNYTSLIAAIQSLPLGGRQ